MKCIRLFYSLFVFLIYIFLKNIGKQCFSNGPKWYRLTKTRLKNLSTNVLSVKKKKKKKKKTKFYK